jgi:hypothetical protein
MRRDQHIGHAPSRAVGPQRLGVDDVELPGLQCGNQVLSHDATATRDFDENHPGLGDYIRKRLRSRVELEILH